MKNLILISAILLVGGCWKSETESGKPQKPSSPEEKLVGSYEASEEDGDTFKLILLENGRFEIHFDGQKEEEGTWKFEEKEVHVLGDGREVTSVLKIESNGDLTEIANIGEERTELPFRKERAFKRIK